MSDTTTYSGEPPRKIMTDEFLLSILRDPLAETIRWRAHGIGFMKAYIDSPANEWRINVYNSLLRVPGITVMHDHPWHLTSYVRCGRLTNTRIARSHRKSAGAFLMNEGTINCENFRGIEGKPDPVVLVRRPSEIVERDQWYMQTAHEIHDTEAADGTVTILHRQAAHGKHGRASLFWPLGDEYVDASRSITETEILKVAETAAIQLENDIASRT